MEIVILNKSDLPRWVSGLPASPVVAVLLAGDRLSCCDEAVGLKVEDKIVGVATIAPRGEYGAGGQPTIVALYVVPSERRKGYGQILQEAAVKRCLERGFEKIRIDVMSSYAMRTINSLPEHLKSALDVHDMGSVMDLLEEMEGYYR